MKKNNPFLIFTASLIMISMLAFRPYAPAHSDGVSTTPLQLIALKSIDTQKAVAVAPVQLENDFHYSSQAAALTAIDTEMASIVSKYGSLTAVSDPGDLLAYRWLAMAKDYVELSYTPTQTSTNTPFIPPTLTQTPTSGITPSPTNIPSLVLTFTPSPTPTNTPILTPSITPAKGVSLIPPGVYTSTGQQILTLNGDGTYSELVDISSIVGNWTGAGNQITLTEKSGGRCTGIPGTYTWRLSGKTLTFTLVKDDCSIRVDDLTTAPWTPQ